MLYNVMTSINLDEGIVGDFEKITILFSSEAIDFVKMV